MSTDKKISALIESQLPQYLDTEGPQFQTFIRAYYEWMEQNGQATDVSKNLLNNNDLDEAADQYLKYFKREILSDFPEDILADKRLVYKKIKDLYRAKGTESAYKLLFRILYDEDINLYYPGQDILRASDGRWVQETSLRLVRPFTGNIELIAGTIEGVTSKATADVERIQRINSSGLDVYEIFITNISGAFLDSEEVKNFDSSISGTILSERGSLQNVIILDGGTGHRKGDTVSITSASGTGGRGTIAQTSDNAIVSLNISNTGSNFARTDVLSISNITRTGVGNGVSVVIVDGGYGYRANTQLTFTSAVGSGANVIVETISNANTITIGANTYTFGTINSVSIITRGDGYEDIPLVAVRDDVIAGLNLNQFEANIIDGGSGYTTNATLTLSGGNGQGGSLEVGSISNTSVITVYTDLIADLENTPINGNYGTANTRPVSLKLAAANSNTTLVDALGSANVTVGTISSINVIDSGNNYTIAPTVQAVDELVSASSISDGQGGYLGRNANITISLGNGFIGNTGSAILRAEKAEANASGAPLITAPVEYSGRYNGVQGFLSWSNKLQDNYYYQEFSYVIRSAKTLDTYKDIVNSVVHPSGTKFFGDLLITLVIDPITNFLPGITTETILHFGEQETIGAFIPTVVSADIDQYEKSEDEGAISDYPEVEIELVEPVAVDVSVDITGAGYQLEIELIAAQRSALLDSDDIILPYLQRLIEGVTVNTPFTLGDTPIDPEYTNEIIDDHKTETFNNLARLGGDVLSVVSTDIVLERITVLDSIPSTQTYYYETTISSLQNDIIDNHKTETLSDVASYSGMTSDHIVEFGPIDTNTISSTAALSADHEIGMGIGGADLNTISSTAVVSNAHNIYYEGTGSINVNYISENLSSYEDTAISYLAELPITSAGTRTWVEGFSTTFNTDGGNNQPVAIRDSSNTGVVYYRTIDYILDANTMFITANTDTTVSNGEIFYVN